MFPQRNCVILSTVISAVDSHFFAVDSHVPAVDEHAFHLLYTPQVYEASAKMLVESVLQGRGNATCFCYGATGTGKTHTMLGSKQDPGIMVLSLRDIFQHVNDGSDLEVSMSYLEVYNEQVQAQTPILVVHFISINNKLYKDTICRAVL